MSLVRPRDEIWTWDCLGGLGTWRIATSIKDALTHFSRQMGDRHYLSGTWTRTVSHDTWVRPFKSIQRHNKGLWLSPSQPICFSRPRRVFVVSSTKLSLRKGCLCSWKLLTNSTLAASPKLPFVKKTFMVSALIWYFHLSQNHLGIVKFRR